MLVMGLVSSVWRYRFKVIVKEIFMSIKTGKLSFVSKAGLTNARISARKARLVIDMIRGQSVEKALDILDCCDKKTAPLVKKVILSALANAQDKHRVDADELIVKSAWVDEGRTFKRFMPRAQGSASPIRHRHSHINVVLDEVA
jgi:large subunit ribosomal protein L22